MKKISRPTNLLLVGFVFLLIYFSPCCKAESTPDSLLQVREFHAQFLRPTTCLSSCQLDPSHQITKENIVPGHPKALSGLVALNAKKKQNLGYEGPLESGITSNSMGIEVKGITVIAMNMMENGNAIADSNIILNPVQYINFIGPDEEIGEKLK